MKEYPMDRFAPILFWPMLTASRVKSKPLKVLLVLLYVPWALALVPIMVPVLGVSIGWAVWDSVNE